MQILLMILFRKHVEILYYIWAMIITLSQNTCISPSLSHGVTRIDIDTGII